MEVAPLRMTNEGRIEILLTQRPADDKHWPNEWHIPGTVIRSTDEPGNFHTGFQRVLHDELNDAVVYPTEPQFVGVKFWDAHRGRELDHLHYVEVSVVDGAKVPGQFFDVTQLPETTIATHKIMIPEIAEAYRQRKSQASTN